MQRYTKQSTLPTEQTNQAVTNYFKSAPVGFTAMVVKHVYKCYKQRSGGKSYPNKEGREMTAQAVNNLYAFLRELSTIQDNTNLYPANF